MTQSLRLDLCIAITAARQTAIQRGTAVSTETLVDVVLEVLAVRERGERVQSEAKS